MKHHLTAEQFVDAIEARVDLPRAVSAHLAGCEACRAEQARLTEALGDARAVSMPEPSPLFWDHLSRRVRAATSDEAVPRVTAIDRLWRRGWRPLATVAIAACALTLVAVMRSGPRVDDLSRAAGPAVAGLTPTGGPAEAVAVDDGGLNVVAVLAADLRTEDLRQVAPSADAAGAAIEDLTPAQCQELMRLIKAQMSGAE